MFGLKRLKRRYRRFRYNNQARFPRFFVILAMLKLPIQLLLVVLPLWIAVGVYNDHFSFEARQQSGAMSSVEPSVGSEQESNAESFVAIDRARVEEGRNSSVIAPDVVVTSALVPAEEALMHTVDSSRRDADASAPLTEPNHAPKAGQLVDNGKSVIVKSVPFSAIEELPDDGSPVAAEDLLPVSEKALEVAAVVERLSGPVQNHADPMLSSAAPEVRDAAWLAAQNDSSYVIQLESSANYAIMQQQALKLSATGDLAVYPFVLSRDGEVIYGMSYGLYDTLSAARTASQQLPGDLVRFGTWIRHVGTLKRQMTTVSSAGLVSGR